MFSQIAFEGFVPALLGAGVDCELWAGTLAQQWMLLARRGALESPSEPLCLAVQGHAGEYAAFMTSSLRGPLVLTGRRLDSII